MAGGAGSEEGVTAAAVDSLAGALLVGASVDGWSVEGRAVVATVVDGAAVEGLVVRATIGVLEAVVGPAERVGGEGPMVSGPAFVCMRAEPEPEPEQALSVVAVATPTSAVTADTRHSERRPRVAGSVIRLSVEQGGAGLGLRAAVRRSNT
jgi:hypothetical protein